MNSCITKMEVFLGYLGLVFLICSSVLAEDPSVVIVGAGVAGISAAAKLLENGITNIRIIEAEDRIGGRIKTVTFGDSYVDEGAQYVHGEEGNVVYQMVKDLDLLEHSTGLTDLGAKVYYSNGSTFEDNLSEDLQDIILNYADVIQKENVTALSLGEAFMNQYTDQIINKYSNDAAAMKIVNEAVRFAQSLILMHEAAFHWEDPAAGRHYTRCEGDQMMSWKQNGYQIIFDVLTKAYPNSEEKLPVDEKVLLNTKVSKITWSTSPVSVETSDGNTYSADYVILTPSVGVLSADHEELFEPQLPDSKKEAIDALGLDGILKIILHFPEKWWSDEDGVFYFLWSEEDLNNSLNEFPNGPVRDGVSWITHIVGLVQVEGNPNTLIFWVSSDIIPDIEKTADDILLNGSMLVIRKFLGRDYDISDADQVMKSEWCSNTNFRGTFSYERTGYFEVDHSYQEQLAEPLTNSEGSPVVLFAGEATSPKHYSTVHGAVESGQREADRIINLFNSSASVLTLKFSSTVLILAVLICSLHINL